MRDYEKIIVDLQKMRSTEYCVITSAPDFPAYKILMEAICAIEELLAKDTNVPNKNVGEWISVEERLPKTADFVLTCSGEYVTENLLCTTIDVEGKHLVWAFCDGLVTHWMPLPAPPKEVE